jgi:hypothetical protein
MADDTTPLGASGYGFALRNTPFATKNFGSLSTSTVNMVHVAVSAILPAVAGKTYKVWGVSTSTSATAAFGGILEDSAGTDIMATVASLGGPFNISLESPIRLPVSLGVSFNCTTITDNGCNVTVYYTEE